MGIFERRLPALPPPPDLDSQFHDLLDQVLDSERRERMNDRIDSSIRAEEWREGVRRREAKK